MKGKFTFTMALFIIFMVVTSCDKRLAKQMAGFYDCRVDYHYFDILPTTIDSTYYVTIEVEQEEQHVLVLGRKIHVDSLRGGNEYKEGGAHSKFTLQIINDGLIMKTSGGGQGGIASHSYVGTKQ